MNYRASGNDPSAFPHQESDAATLNMLERNLKSIQVEVCMGTKIDADLVRDLVSRIEHLREGESRNRYEGFIGPIARF